MDNSVKKCLNTFVLECCTRKHWNYVHIDTCCFDTSHDLFSREFFTFHIFFHKRFVTVNFRNTFDKFFSVLFSLVLKLRTNLLLMVGRTHFSICIPNDLFHLDKVNNTFEVLFSTDRKLDDKRVTFESVSDLSFNFKEISTGSVHFIHENQ